VSAARVMVVDDHPVVRDGVALLLRGEPSLAVVGSAESGRTALDRARELRPDLVLLDLRLPDLNGFEVLERIREHNPVVIMITGHGDVPDAVRAMQAGAESFLTKPVELAHLGAVATRALEKARLRQMNRYLADRRGRLPATPLLGTSAPMRELAQQIELLARSDRTTVLITGESGTGKGYVAESIHRASARGERPMVEINCAALSGATLDAELFGQELTPSNGSDALRPGLLDIAEGGSVFLDEIGDLDPQLQPKLLRVLEGKSFRRLGGTREITADVRLIAATGKDLVSEVTDGKFREDLYYRLSVMPINLPPLRARSREDLLELIARLVEELRPNLIDAPTELDDEVLERLLKYAWPGNIRELRNVLERAMIMARGLERVAIAHLPTEVREASGSGVDHHIPRTLSEVERIHIDRTLRAHNANRTRAARELGISRATLIKKIKEYGLESNEARPTRQRVIG